MEWIRHSWDTVEPLAIIIGHILLVVAPLIVAMAMTTYYERKVIAAMQLRRGPNVVGFLGLLQPFADGFKLILKETIFPTNANKVVFLIAPMLTFGLAMLGWAVIPLSPNFVIANINVGILYLFAISFARRVWHYHGRLGKQLQICVPWRHPLQRPDGKL